MSGDLHGLNLKKCRQDGTETQAACKNINNN